MAEESLKEVYKRKDIEHMLHGMVLPSEFAKSGSVFWIKGSGVKIWDSNGKEYIDTASLGMVATIGHGNQELADAAREQILKIQHTPSFFGRGSLPEVDLASKLAELTPEGLQRFMFTNSGSDANDSAFKIVRWYWRQKGFNKYKIISLDWAYHGATFGAMSASPIPDVPRASFEPLVPGFIHIATHNCYRCPFGKSYPSCDIDCAQALEKAIEKEGGDTVGAFIAEPILGGGYYYVPPPEYWPKVREICTKHNVLLIIDEVITGFGRTGKFFASEHWNLRPDIMTFAKGLASGYIPIAGIAISDEIYKGMTEKDTPFPHMFTFGGHAVGCAVALKNIEIILRDKLVDNSARLGAYLKDRLRALQEKSPYVGDVRGLGLYCCMELVADKTTKARFDPKKQVGMQIRSYLVERGIVGGGIPGLSNIGLAPPLVIQKDQLDYVVDAIEGALRNIKV